MGDDGSELECYEIVCEKGHRLKLGPSQLEDFIREVDQECPKCGGVLDLDGDLDLHCHICSMIHQVSSLEEALYTMDDRCNACPVDFKHDSIHVPSSWYEHVAEYDWMRSGRDAEPLKRRGRTDYWEGLIHFCTVEEFASIQTDGRIRAGRTGYFKVPSVCLTEATVGNWTELQTRHGRFGYVFRKRDLLACGGGPALYMPQRLIASQKSDGGFCDEVKPFVNLLRVPSISPREQKHDFLHEREWRVPADVDLRQTEPFGVIIHWPDVTRKVKGWSSVFHAAMQYEELNEQRSGSNTDE